MVYCNAGDSGPIVGQVAQITLSPTLATTGESLNYGQIGQSLSASAVDCKGNSVSISKLVYASSDSTRTFADINPNSGQVCAGTWNRNTGGGIADYTVCTAPAVPPTAPAPVSVTVPAGAGSVSYTAPVPGAVQVAGGTVTSITYTSIATGAATPESFTSGVVAVQTGDVVKVVYTAAPTVVFTPSGVAAYVTATASGATSNAIPVFVHAITTSVVLGGSTGLCTTDPGTDCCPNNTTGTTVTAPVYTGNACISQNTTGQLIARVYQGGNTSPANNITCQVGHITFAPQSSNIVSIDQNGVATANQPGSTLVTATLSNSSTGQSAGFFSTCPPASITLNIPGQAAGTSSVNVGVNNLQPLTATILDTNGVQLNGLSLEFNSTTPQTIPATVGSVTPSYPGTAVITAVCQPGTCNPAPFSQIGLYGNGTPITSNGITITASGTAETVIYMGSNQSQYVMPMDFSTNQPGSLIKLPYLPNSMVISQDGSSIYLGSSQGLMSITTTTNTQGTVNESVPGTVLAISPDGTSVVVTDPVRQTVSLYSPSSGSVTTSYGAVGTSAKWSPDTQTVYITTTTGVVLTHNTFTNWQSTALSGADSLYTDVAVMVPSIGAYFAGGPNSAATEGRSYCPSGVVTGTTTPQTVSNTFYPLADEDAAVTDKVAATNDGKHILGATVTAPARLSDLTITEPQIPVNQPNGPQACTTLKGQARFTSTFTTHPLTGVTATAINGVVPAANSSLAFVTYTGTSGLLPYYIPSTAVLNFFTLGNGATAATSPVSGVFSTDGLTFYVGTGAADGTSADNDVHILSINGTTLTETGILSPALPLYSGAAGVAPVNFLVQKPKKSQI